MEGPKDPDFFEDWGILRKTDIKIISMDAIVCIKLIVTIGKPGGN